jgi:hypothetical protein
MTIPKARKPVVAWALLAANGDRIAGSFVDADFGHVVAGERVIKLVEASPARDAVVRLACKLIEDDLLGDPGSSSRAVAVLRAEQRLQRKGRK